MRKNTLYTAYGTMLSLALSTVAYGITEDFKMVVKTPQENASLSYFFDASFIYWYAKEDGLNIAENAVVNSHGVVFLAPKGEVLQQSFSYNPGFKVGTGIQGENWSLQTEYTWLRSKTSTSKSASVNTSSVTGLGVWNMDDWFLQSTTFGQSPTGTHISSDWHLGLDMIDLLASNPLYQEKNVKVVGFGGLRSGWIRQKMNIALTQAAASVGSIYLPEQPIHSLNSSHSWGIGPKIGLDTQYLLPKGFRFEGLFAASLLYTRFASVKHYEDAITNLSADHPVATSAGFSSSVRPIMELGLGMGWRMGMFQDRYYIDFLASYDFSVFWGQNVMRKMLDEFWAGTSSSPNDLYFHGLTLETSFRF